MVNRAEAASFGVPLVAAPGFRDAGDYGIWGDLMAVGNDGYSWSSTGSSTNGMNLGFSVTWLNPSNPSSRAHGLQLRCLSE